MELVLCAACRRHVATTERTCPFCASAVPVQRPQRARAVSLTRAAIFSAAALASGCESKKPAPAPVPAQGSGAGTNNDDLEKMLDSEGHVADVPTIDSGLVDAGLVDAPLADASVPVDAGMSDEQKQRIQRQRDQRRREIEQRKLEQQQRELQIQQREMAKPYGAPPARRRIV